MKLEKTYQTISSILTPLTFLLGFIMLPSMLMSLSNPYVLFGLFVMVCTIIYVVKSIGFFRKNVLKDTPAKVSTKHMIYINGAFALFFFIEVFVAFLVVYFSSTIVKDVLKKMLDQVSIEMQQNLSVDEMYKVMKITITILFIYALLLATHVIMSYILVSKYKKLFKQ